MILHSKTGRRLRGLILILLLAGLAGCALIVADGLTDDATRSDVAVVLGNKVEPDGRPSPMLQARLEEALRVYRRGLAPNLVVSGGIGREGFDEAQVMKAWLVQRGVPASDVVTDNRGVNTWATAANLAPLMRTRGWRSCMIVTQYFHVSRTRLALRRHGVAAIRSTHARYFSVRDLWSIPRDAAGYVAYLIRPADRV